MHRTHLGLRQTSGLLWALVVSLLLAAVGTAYFFFTIVDQVRIGSERYDQLISIKELQSQVSLPSSQVTKAHLSVQQLVLSEDAPKPKDIAALSSLNRGYEQRYDEWIGPLADSASPDLQAALDVSHVAAGTYFATLEGTFLSAARDGDRAAMIEAATGPLAQQYALHEAIAEKLAAVADEQLNSAERAIAADLVSDRRLMLAAGLLFGLLAVGLVLLTLRSMSSRLRRMRHLTDRELPRLVARAEALAAVGATADSRLSPAVRGNDELARTERALHRVVDSAVELAGETARLRHTTADLFAYTGRRNHQSISLGLARLSGLEDLGLDPQRAAGLAELRSALIRMRRNAESMLVIAGVAPTRQWDEPAAPLQALQAALAEVEGAARVDWNLDASATISGPAGADLAHLLAELLDNATRFSSPESAVSVRGLREGDEYLILIGDDGLGMPAVQLAAVNELLANSEVDVHESRQLGLSVVARLADRHDFKVTLEARPTGGLVARVRLPASCLQHVAAAPENAEPAPTLALAQVVPPAAVALTTSSSVGVVEPIALPRRIRGASLDPALHEVPAYVGAAEDRSPEAVRAALAALATGQAAAADRHPGQSGLTP